MIDIRNVTKSYGPKVAVQDLSLQVPAGELFAFLGPNGAGKTTTIKMLCGLLFPTSGTVRVGGFDLRTQGDQARALVSYVPDQPFLYEKLTGREFLQFTADLYAHAAPRRPPSKIDEVIELFHLDEFVDDLTERYSHGMRQRTVFAAALVHEPKLLIADEPTVGLDPKSIRELKTLLRRLADDGTTIFSQHAHARHRPGTRRPHRHHRPRPAPRLRHNAGPAKAGSERRQPGGTVPEDHRGAREKPCHVADWNGPEAASPGSRSLNRMGNKYELCLRYRSGPRLPPAAPVALPQRLARGAGTGPHRGWSP